MYLTVNTSYTRLELVTRAEIISRNGGQITEEQAQI